MSRTPTLDYLAAAAAQGASGHAGPGADQCTCDDCLDRQQAHHTRLRQHPEETPCTA